MMDIRYNGRTDIGRQREDNQDTFLAEEITFMGSEAVLLAAVDGVGGYAGGGIAAMTAATSLRAYLDACPLPDPEAALEQAMVIANNAVFDARRPGCGDMGCVASTCVLDGRHALYYAHVGDTRIYIYKDGQLQKVSHDHSLVGAMEEEGELTEQEAMEHPHRNIISRMLGEEPHRRGDGFVEHGTVHISGPSQVLLCSDGLTDQLCAREIKAILDEDIPPEEKTARMIHEANEKGGKDNITVVLAEVNIPADDPVPPDCTAQTKETTDNNKMNKTMNNRSKKNGIIAMIVVTLCFLLASVCLYRNQRPMLETVKKAYGEKRAVCMNGDLPARTLEAVLVKNGYYRDEDDARCISLHWTALADNARPVETLWGLKRWTCQLPALKARSEGGKVLRTLADSSFAKIGVTPEVKAMYANGGAIPPVATGADAVIEARVVDSETREAIPGTIVRLKEHYYETVPQDTLERRHVIETRDSVVAYAMTDERGIARFDAVPGRSYSVLPVKEGYEYGQEKGTVDGYLKSGRTTYTFKEREHRIDVFPESTFSQIKTSMAVTVRTPEEYSGKYLLSILVFLLSWWLAFFAVLLRDRKLGQPSETALIPVLMMITGVGLLAQFSMLNPMTDRLLGFKTALTVGLASIIFVVLQRLDVVRWYASDYRLGGRRIKFDPLTGSSFRPLGRVYALAAFALLLLLCFFGSSPEHSDAKISLFGAFQPADLVKLLVVVFLAAFFSAREDEIRAFSKTTDKVSLRLQLRTVALVCAWIVAICALYLIVLSSMGEGLILVLVFISCYSLARGDLWQMALGVVTYVAFIVVAELVSPSVWAVVIASALWLALWLGISLLGKKVIYESAVFFNLLLFIIAAGGSILKMVPLTAHQGEKLLNRKEMTFTGVWENEVPGVGDQVYLSIQGIATGGLTGQGLGKGHPNLTPAFTTDMVIAGISEQMGYVMIVCLMMAYMILAYLGMKTALKSGHPFVYYLVIGITLATIIQWLYIFGATLGVFCLSGVPAPMLAYGKSSLLLHVMAYSLVVAASRYPAGSFRSDVGAPVRSVLVLPAIYMVAILLLGYGMRYAVFERSSTIARPGVFLTSDEDLSVEYNPRIAKVLDRLDAGDIYDRNGLLLATSSREKVLDNIESYADCGIPVSFVEEEAGRYRRRYYPFGPHLSYVIGTYDDNILWSNSLTNPYGLGIEHSHFSFLRGFDNSKKDRYGNPYRETVTHARRQTDRFLPERSVEVSETVTFYDYSAIVPLVKRGAGARAMKRWNESRSSRNITLTLDAKLQAVLQRRMAEKIAEDPVLSRNPQMIVDVFVQEVKTGDMLASANYPLPDLEAIRDLNSRGQYRFDESDPNARAIAMRDAAITQTPCGSAIKPAVALAAQMSRGENVFNQSFYVDEKEIIERGRVKEPYGHRVGFDEAMKNSSNGFFIFFGLHNDVFRKMGELFKLIGVRLDGHEGRGALVPYVLDQAELTPKTDASYDAEVDYMRNRAVPLYQTYAKQRDEEGKPYRLNAFRGSGEWWGWFYGQSTIHASPLNMARLVSIIASDGVFIPTRYVLKLGNEDVPVKDSVILVSEGTGRLLESMCSEAQKHRERGYVLPGSVDGVGRFFSKTGTPERGLYVKDGKGGLVYTVQNDGWYIFGLPCASTQSYLAVAIRMERLGSGGSSLAVKFASEVVIPAFRECGYQVD